MYNYTIYDGRQNSAKARDKISNYTGSCSLEDGLVAVLCSVPGARNLTAVGRARVKGFGALEL